VLVSGEWVNEWSVTTASQTDYQDFGRAQLEVYNAAFFGWAYWTLKNDRKHWDFEWNIRNNDLQLGKISSFLFGILPPPLFSSLML
jgi:aryl-phospho-beta-D-glucosidase BglC (GH1 family)